jgi:outer membrane protein OmpU
MNKLTKIGASALCGSLAAISGANAGALTVAGGIDMTWSSMGQNQNSSTGNPIGIGSNYTLSGSGEMDNGWTAGLSIAMTNANAYSNTNVSVTIPSLGDLRISQGVSGSGIDRIDDITPNVWEEAYASGLSTGINTVGGVSGSANIEYTPNMLPEGLTARIAYSPSGGSAGADKSTSGAGNTVGGGYDVIVSATDAIHGMAGLTLDAGISSRSNKGSTNQNGDLDENTLAITYAVGSFTLGYQMSEEDLGTSAAEQQYDNDGYGITFAINDDLSIGYNKYESKQTNATNVTAEADSVQIAYSMGGASVRVMSASADNMDYNTGAAYDRDNTVISVSLAF